LLCALGREFALGRKLLWGGKVALGS